LIEQIGLDDSKKPSHSIEWLALAETFMKKQVKNKESINITLNNAVTTLGAAVAGGPCGKTELCPVWDQLLKKAKKVKKDIFLFLTNKQNVHFIQWTSRKKASIIGDDKDLEDIVFNCEEITSCNEDIKNPTKDLVLNTPTVLKNSPKNSPKNDDKNNDEHTGKMYHKKPVDKCSRSEFEMNYHETKIFLKEKHEIEISDGQINLIFAIFSPMERFGTFKTAKINLIDIIKAIKQHESIHGIRGIPYYDPTMPRTENEIMELKVKCEGIVAFNKNSHEKQNEFKVTLNSLEKNIKITDDRLKLDEDKIDNIGKELDDYKNKMRSRQYGGGISMQEMDNFQTEIMSNVNKRLKLYVEQSD